jgi:hypothetical protein
VAVQRQEDLPVRELRFEPMGGVHGERGLPDPRHPVNGMDSHHAAGIGATRSGGSENVELLLTPQETGNVARQGSGGRLPGRSVAARGCHERLPLKAHQSQSVCQQLGSVVLGCLSLASLKVTYGPSAQPCLGRQRLLRHPRPYPCPLEEFAERPAPGNHTKQGTQN